MSEFNQSNVSEIELRAAYAEDALRPGGVGHEIAQNLLEQPVELSPREVGDVLLPPKQPGQAGEARWQLIEGAKDEIKSGANQYQDAIFALAEILDMKRTESISDIDIARISPTEAIWLVEGGANRTSIVRRSLALEATERVYGSEAAGLTICQFGSDRPIPRERGGKPNPEYVIAQDIAGDFLPDGDRLTEHGLNLASALQGGYRLVGEIGPDSAAQLTLTLEKENSPRLLIVMPHKYKGGLEDGLDAVGAVMDLTGKQFIIATNGQYRPKDEQQAAQWAAGRGIDMLPPVAIGDEPGYAVEHNGIAYTTADRAALAFLNEAVILDRQNKSAPVN